MRFLRHSVRLKAQAKLMSFTHYKKGYASHCIYSTFEKASSRLKVQRLAIGLYGFDIRLLKLKLGLFVAFRLKSVAEGAGSVQHNAVRVADR